MGCWTSGVKSRRPEPRCILESLKPLGLVLMGLICGLPSLAQPWEVGVGAGYGAYRSASVRAPAGVATAGLRPGAVEVSRSLSAVLRAFPPR